MNHDIRQLEHDVYSYQQANILKLPDAIEKFNQVASHVETQMGELGSLQTLNIQFEEEKGHVVTLNRQVTQLQLELENLRFMLNSSQDLIHQLYPEEKKLRVYQNRVQLVNDYKLAVRLLSIKPSGSAVIKVNQQRFTLELGKIEPLVVNNQKNRKKSCYIEILEPDDGSKSSNAYADIQLRCGALI